MVAPGIVAFVLLDVVAAYRPPRATVANQRRAPRIANGEQLDRNNSPYVVGLKTERFDGRANYCTGTLLSPLFVLTAAHCVADAASELVYQNDPRNLKSEKRNVVEIFIHPLFNDTSLVADLCLLKMDKPFENITSYAPISGYPDLFRNGTALRCVILGWGKNEFGYPKTRANAASVRVKYGPDACRVPPDNDFVKDIVARTWAEFLCPVPDNRMACIGDSGGALVCHGFLLGITSHGYNYHPGMSRFRTVCGDVRVQTRHVFVRNHREWIESVVDGPSASAAVNRDRGELTTLGLLLCLASEGLKFRSAACTRRTPCGS